MNPLTKVLSELEPYVIVVGSYATGKATASSDIDLYVKRRPEEELEVDWYGELEEHYMDKVIEVFENNQLSWDSLVIGYIHTEDLAVQLEASSLFRIHKDAELKTIELFGVRMLSAVDDKETPSGDRFE